MGEGKIKLSSIVEKLDLEVKCGEELLDREVKGGYVSDLLSDVMANIKEGYIWITLQGHQNIVAVAVLKGIAGIIIINERQPEEETIEKAKDEGIPIMTSSRDAFELAGKLYESGIPGTA